MTMAEITFINTIFVSQNRFETDINNLKKALTLKEAHLAEMNEKEKDKQ